MTLGGNVGWSRFFLSRRRDITVRSLYSVRLVPSSDHQSFTRKRLPFPRPSVVLLVRILTPWTILSFTV